MPRPEHAGWFLWCVLLASFLLGVAYGLAWLAEWLGFLVAWVQGGVP